MNNVVLKNLKNRVKEHTSQTTFSVRNQNCAKIFYELHCLDFALNHQKKPYCISNGEVKLSRTAGYSTSR